MNCNVSILALVAAAGLFAAPALGRHEQDENRLLEQLRGQFLAAGHAP